MFATAVASVIGLMALQRFRQRPRVEQVYLKGLPRLVHDESMSLQAYRNFGQFLTQSGHPDENRYRFIVPLSLGEMQHQYVRQQKENLRLLNNTYFNTGLVKRQQFKGPSDEVHWPLAQMGSGWYTKAATRRRPYVTRILPGTTAYEI